MITATTETIDAITPLWIEILTELGADRPFLNDVELNRQLARGEADGEVVRALDSETARDLRPATEDRLVDVRRRQNLVVKDDCEWLANILLGHPPEAARAGGVESDVDVWPAVLVETLLGVGQLVARDHHSALHGHEAVTIGHRENLAAWRRVALLNFLRIGRQIDELELQPRGLADQLLKRFRVLDARHFDENTIATFGDDGNFFRSRRVDAAPDDIASDSHCVLQRLRGPARRRNHDDPGRIDDLDVPIAVSGERDRLGQVPKPLDRGIDLSRVSNHE